MKIGWQFSNLDHNSVNYTIIWKIESQFGKLAHNLATLVVQIDHDLEYRIKIW